MPLNLFDIRIGYAGSCFRIQFRIQLDAGTEANVELVDVSIFVLKSAKIKEARLSRNS